MYRTAPGDAAFMLIGLIPDVPTDTATSTPTDTATATLTNTATYTPTETSTSTPTDTPTNTATSTSTYTLTATQTNTSTSTSTYTATATQTSTATYTPRPKWNTPGRVTGGGTIRPNKNGGKATFGFRVSYNAGDLAPTGNLTYQDHTSRLRLKATSFHLLMIDGTHAWIAGTGTLSNGQVVSFTVSVDADRGHGQPDIFRIYIPALNGYRAGGALSGGNITIHD